jgi:hypothetical protein
MSGHSYTMPLFFRRWPLIFAIHLKLNIMKSFKIFSLLVAFLFSASAISAQNQYAGLTLQYTAPGVPLGAVQVNAVYTKFPNLQGGAANLTFYPNNAAVQNITPAFGSPFITYRLESLTFTWGGYTGTTNQPHVQGGTVELGGGDFVQIYNDNNGNYRFLLNHRI